MTLRRFAEHLLFVGFLVLLAGGHPVAAQSPVPEGATVETIADGFQFTEGPYWRDAGDLVFTDIPANRVYRWTEDDSISVFLEPSGHANGISADADGHLLLAQHDGRVVRLTPEKEVEVLASEYRGQRLNSPNDLDVRSDGSIYFTDPPYGVDDEDRELDFSGVYRLHPDGTLELLIDAFPRPNGIAFSPDESRLYVNDARQTRIYVYDVDADGSLSNRRVFAEPTDDEAEGTTDGMEVDAEGRLYTTGPGGVWIYRPDGTLVDRIPTPQRITNLAFGGPNLDTLYITAPSAVYRIDLEVEGLK